MQHQKLIKTAAILLILVLSVIILKYGKPFLVPLAFASLLSMLLLPVCTWLEKKRVHKALAVIFSILLIVSFVAVVMVFISWQISDLAEDASRLKQQVSEKYQQVQLYIREELGISPEKQKEMMEEQQESSGGKTGLMNGMISVLGGFFVDALLVLVYIFLLLFFRRHLKRFILRIVPDSEEKKAVTVVDRIQQVAQKYLTGLSLMIVCLWIMYGIGFSIVGIKHAILFAVLCGLLEIVPFVGNLLGNLLAILMALSQGGGINMIIGILITYALIQFIQTYILEPLVVGAEVNINPLFTILVLVAGELTWGIPGMVLAIPLLGMAKIVFDHVEALKPYGELIGEEKKEPNRLKKKITVITTKIKQRNRKKATKTA
jgi:predicted PurR-regulated permease PerM